MVRAQRSSAYSGESSDHTVGRNASYADVCANVHDREDVERIPLVLEHIQPVTANGNAARRPPEVGHEYGGHCARRRDAAYATVVVIRDIHGVVVIHREAHESRRALVSVAAVLDAREWIASDRRHAAV